MQWLSTYFYNNYNFTFGHIFHIITHLSYVFLIYIFLIISFVNCGNERLFRNKVLKFSSDFNSVNIFL
jgi:hypothetical protein